MRSYTEGAFALIAGRTMTALFPPSSGVCTEALRSCRAVPLALAEGAGRKQDAELSAYCTAAVSIRACALWRRLQPSGIEGSGMA